jgi:hypothetical protein
MSQWYYMVAFLETRDTAEISLELQRGALVGMMVSKLKVIGKKRYNPLKLR